jgi:hypothetical protein
VKVESAEPSPELKASKSIDEPDFVVGDPTEDDLQKAQKIYDGNEDFIQRERAAAWMGEEGPVRQRTLRAYMNLYDFQDKSVVASLRQVCNRLVLRAETQQVDRILVAFAKRWCDCNPNHGFKTTGRSLPGEDCCNSANTYQTSFTPSAIPLCSSIPTCIWPTLSKR